MANKKENELLDLGELVRSAEKGLSALEGKRKEYVAIMESMKKVTLANVAATEILNKMEKTNALQLVASNGGLTFRQTLMGIYNGQITVTTAATGLWAKAQNALNIAIESNPIGIAVVAIGALVAAIKVCELALGDAANSTGNLSEKQREIIENSKNTIENLREEAEARKESIVAAATEFDSAQSLWGELQKCVDANGKIKEGYETRVQYISGELTDALGIEIDLVNGQIQNYEKLNQSVKDMIASKRAEAMLDAMKEDYTKAMREQGAIADELSQKYNAVIETKQRIKNLEAELAEESKKSVEHLNATGDVVVSTTDRHKELVEELVKERGELQAQQSEFDATNEKMKDNAQVIKDHNLVLEASMENDANVINNMLAQMGSNIDASVKASSEVALQQTEDMAQKLLSIISMQEKGMADIQQVTIDKEAQTLGLALNVMSDSAENMTALLESAGVDGAVKMLMAFQNADIAGNLCTEAQSGMEAMISTMASMDGALSEEGRKSLYSFLSGFEELDVKTQETWSQVWYGALAGLEGFEQLADPAKVGADTFLESLNTALDVHSPSGAVRDIFAYVWPGAEEGLAIGKEGPLAKAGEFVSEFLGRFTGSGLFGTIAGIGSSAMQWFSSGVLSQSDNAKGSGTSVANSAKTGVESVSASTSGYNFGAGFGSGIGNAVDSVIKAAKRLGGRALSALKEKLGINSPSKETAKFGRSTGKGFVKGIKEQIPQVEKASEELAASALQHMDVQGYLAKMRSAMSMEKATIGANLTSRVVYEVVMGNQSDFMNVGDKIEALQKHIDGIKIQLLLEGKTYIDKREAGYILAPEINKRLGEFAELKGRGNNSK